MKRTYPSRKFYGGSGQRQPFDQSTSWNEPGFVETFRVHTESIMTEFKQDDEETPVIFRKYPKKQGGEIIALFPAEVGGYDPYLCGSYVHVGQHGNADPRVVMMQTRAANKFEYADLKAELEGPPYGYRLKVYKRQQRWFMDARRKQLKQITESK